MEIFFVSFLVDAGGATFFGTVDADEVGGALAGFFELVTVGIFDFDFRLVS